MRKRAAMYVPNSDQPDALRRAVYEHIELRGYQMVACCQTPAAVAQAIRADTVDVVVAIIATPELLAALGDETWRLDAIRQRPRRWTVQAMFSRLYRSGMSPRELADRLDTDTGDVRKHLHDGLE